LNTLILGGGGFIGINFTLALQKKLLSNELIVVIDKNPGKFNLLENLPNVVLYKGNANNIELIRSILNKYNIDAIIHLAANSDIKNGISDYSLDFTDTLITSLTLSEILKEFNIKKVLFASSSAIFGSTSHPIKMKYDQTCIPISPYGWAKLASEQSLKLNSLKTGTTFLNIRFPNVVGRHSTHGILFDLREKLLNDSKILNVLGDGSQTKPYINIDELVEFMLNLWSKNDSIDINFGPKDTISVRKIVEIVLEISGTNPKIIWGDNPSGWLGDVPNYQYDLENFDLKLYPNLNSLKSEKAIRDAFTILWDQK
jgi:UDP-glucose 4-epimerase